MEQNTPIGQQRRARSAANLRSLELEERGRGSWKLRLIEGELRTDESLRLQARPGLAAVRPKLRGGGRN